MNALNKLLSILIIGLFATTAEATFIPQDEIAPLETLSVGEPNITEEQFNAEMDRVYEIYKPIVEGVGGKLKFEGQWDDDTINAFAVQRFGTWKVSFLGGLARRPEMTLDAMTLVLCHELGHHLAGFSFSKKMPFPIPGLTWPAANEGQSDYYATHVCAGNVWGNDLGRNAEFMEIASEKMKFYCDSVWEEQPRRNLCYRSLVAAESLAFTLSALRKDKNLPRFDSPDPKVVAKTSHAHPATQCRLDTSLQGALCTAKFDESIVPGKPKYWFQSKHNIKAERAALPYSCTDANNYAIGVRPSCWFKSRLVK